MSDNEEEIRCHHTAFKHTCKKHRRNCIKWILVQGKDPQTNKDIDMWDCADKWSVTLLMDIARRNIETAGEVSSFRSEMRKQNEEILSLQYSRGRTTLLGIENDN